MSSSWSTGTWRLGRAQKACEESKTSYHSPNPDGLPNHSVAADCSYILLQPDIPSRYVRFLLWAQLSTGLVRYPNCSGRVPRARRSKPASPKWRMPGTPDRHGARSPGAWPFMIRDGLRFNGKGFPGAGDTLIPGTRWKKGLSHISSACFFLGGSVVFSRHFLIGILFLSCWRPPPSELLIFSKNSGRSRRAARKAFRATSVQVRLCPNTFWPKTWAPSTLRRLGLAASPCRFLAFWFGCSGSMRARGTRFQRALLVWTHLKGSSLKGGATRPVCKVLEEP